MARSFRGNSANKVDAKGRVSIPAPFRRVLEEGDPDWPKSPNPNLVLIYGRKGGKCLEGYTINGIEALDKEIAKLPRFSKRREAMEYMINTCSIYVQVDENGRIVLPQKLRDMLGVTNEATFAGKGEKFQIWETSAYDADTAKIKGWVDEVAGEEDPFTLLEDWE